MSFLANKIIVIVIIDQNNNNNNNNNKIIIIIYYKINMNTAFITPSLYTTGQLAMGKGFG